MKLLNRIFQGKSASNEPDIIIESNSPLFPLAAFVEQDSKVIYLYLVNTEDKSVPIKSCWVRNLVRNVGNIDIISQMRSGSPPVLPNQLINSSYSSFPLDKDHIELVWFEEGNGVALLENKSILAIIPSWSGKNGFHGFSRDCIKENEVCWPLTTENVLNIKVNKAMLFWKTVEDENFWVDYQKKVLEKYETTFGKIDKYYAIDGGQWPPKALVTIPVSSGTILITLGISIVPQPFIEFYTEEPEKYRRFELGFYASQSISDTDLKKMAAYLSGQSNLPWQEDTWLGNGHTIGCNVFSDIGNGIFNSILLSKKYCYKTIENYTFHEDSVNVLWAIPITDNERKYAEDCGSEELLNAFIEKNIDYAFTERKSIK